MGLDGAYGSISSIAKVDIWGHQLAVTRPLFRDDTMILSADFIINNLEVDPVAALLEAGHNLVVGGNEMVVALILEGFDVDGVVVALVSDHDVLIPTAREDRETAHIICVDTSDVGYLNVQFVGRNLW